MTKAILYSLFATICFNTTTSFGGDLLTGTPKLACEAILCLSSGTRPGECQPSLDVYFGINFKHWSDTVRARKNFLNQCPTVSSSNDQSMSTLISAIANGAGRCDSTYLNSYLRSSGFNRHSISNKLPYYCEVYKSHEYTDHATPVYIGTPECGGYWVDSSNYDSELAKYKANYRCNRFSNRWN
mgnify:CR=1 FL=1|jgi:hypothetical protein